MARAALLMVGATFWCSGCEGPDLPLGGPIRVEGMGGSGGGPSTGSAGAPNADSGGCELPLGQGVASYKPGEVGKLDGTYTLSLSSAASCAGVQGCAIQGRGALVTWSGCDGSRCQAWEAVAIGDQGWFVLRSMSYGGCMAVTKVPGDPSADGDRLLAWACLGDIDQQFRAVCAGDDLWRVVNAQTGRALASTPDDPSFVIQSTIADSADQLWRISQYPEVYRPVLETSERRGIDWRYATNEPTPDWISEGFDDSAWTDGPGPFGRGTALTAFRTLWTSTDIWLRREFELTYVSDALELRISHDDDAEVYVNGVLAFAEAGYTSGHKLTNLSADARRALLLGTNLLAVHCRNQQYASAIDVGLGIVEKR